MNPDTTKIIDRLVLSRDGLRKLDIADYAMIREAREAMADAANALTNYAKTFAVIEQNDQPAAPHILSAPEGVSEAEIVRHMTHEEWRGCRIESYRWKFKIPGASQGSDWDWSYASHWSTPAAHEEAEALVSVKDAERALLSALSSERERAERLADERERLHLLICGGEDAPGLAASLTFDEVKAAHDDHVAFLRDRAQAAEAKVKDSLRDLLAEAYLAGATDVHENYRPDPDPEFGEAAHDYAEAAALRWTETQGEGE